MQKPHNYALNRVQYLLVCLNEECAEVQQRISKAMRFGFTEIQPGQPYTNAQRIAQELADLQVVVQMLQAEGVLPFRGMDKWAEAKKQKLATYIDYSKD